jgi:hypothetical protein
VNFPVYSLLRAQHIPQPILPALTTSVIADLLLMIKGSWYSWWTMLSVVDMFQVSMPSSWSISQLAACLYKMPWRQYGPSWQENQCYVVFCLSLMHLYLCSTALMRSMKIPNFDMCFLVFNGQDCKSNYHCMTKTPFYMFLLCFCYAFAMLLLCFCYAFAVVCSPCWQGLQS